MKTNPISSISSEAALAGPPVPVKSAAAAFGKIAIRPGLNYIVFSGNVGGPNALTQAVLVLTANP